MDTYLTLVRPSGQPVNRLVEIQLRDVSPTPHEPQSLEQVKRTT
jgi:hypothetical protein